MYIVRLQETELVQAKDRAFYQLKQKVLLLYIYIYILCLLHFVTFFLIAGNRVGRGQTQGSRAVISQGVVLYIMT